MKKIILSSALILLSFIGNTLSAQSQSAGKGKQNKNLSVEERVKKETENATAKLGLTDDQKKKWEAACQERITSNAPLKEKLSGSTTPDERKVLNEQINANHKRFDTEVLSFLNDDQKAKYEDFKKNNKGKMAKPYKKGL